MLPLRLHARPMLPSILAERNADALGEKAGSDAQAHWAPWRTQMRPMKATSMQTGRLAPQSSEVTHSSEQ